MPQVCLPAGCIDAIRVALVDECTDRPVPGTASGYVFNCFRSLELTTNIEDGEETVLRNDCGKKCFQTRTCDELTNVGLSFELLNPDYELTNLLTGQSLINDGAENIGWFHTDGRKCSPWLSVELFEQVPDEVCAPGHKYRRIVIPKVRFRPIPTPAREGQMRVVAFEGVSSPASIAAWGTGPFYDSPFDFGDLDPSIQTHMMEFFDSSLTDTIEGVCGYIPVQNNNVFSATWTGQNELTLQDNAGATALCDADQLVVTMADGTTATIALPDPNVSTSADCDTMVISNIDAYTGGKQIIGVNALENGKSVGDYDANRGLPAGQYAIIPPSPGFIEELFPNVNGGGSRIPMGSPGATGCWYLDIWYACDTDVMSWAFNKKDLYGGDVARTEIVTNLGTFTVPVVNEWRTPLTAWTYGSGMQIENASTYGLDWQKIRTFNAAGALICEWSDPVMTWHGGPWDLDQSRCTTATDPDYGDPIINNVVVNP